MIRVEDHGMRKQIQCQLATGLGSQPLTLQRTTIVVVVWRLAMMLRMIAGMGVVVMTVTDCGDQRCFAASRVMNMTCTTPEQGVCQSSRGSEDGYEARHVRDKAGFPKLSGWAVSRPAPMPSIPFFTLDEC